MSTENPSPEGGALTVDQAIESLTAKPEPQEPAAPAEAAVEAVDEPEAPSEADPEAEAPSEPEEANAEGETETEKEEPAQPAIDPPSFWDADAKAAFASLTPEQQTIVSAAAAKQATEASKAIQQAAEAKKAAETQANKVADLAAGLNEFLPRALETFKSRWDGIDWAKWAENDHEAAFKGKLQFEAEQQELQRLASAKEEADRLASERYIADEFAKLPEVAPELADPKEGQQRRVEVAKYLLSEGFSQDILPNVSAVEMKIAYKAMLYDKLKAAPPKITAKPATSPAKPPARPAAAAATPNRNNTAANRFAQTRSVEDAVALLLAPKG